MIYQKQISKTNGIRIYLVDGDAVRRDYYKDFIEGGHGYVYPFIPKNEIWIDDKYPPSQWKPIIAHEFYERSLMMTGLPYELAHRKANAFETAFKKTLRFR